MSKTLYRTPAGWRIPEYLHPFEEGGRRVKNTPFCSPPPLLSIITVTYQAEEKFEDTVKSVLALEGISIQYIVIDGGSTDGTLSIIKKYSEFIDYWMSQKDSGIYHAMNRGIEKAAGKWVLFLNSGDLITHSISRLNEFSTNEYALVHGYTRLIGGPVEYEVYGDIRKWDDWIVRDGVYHQSIAYNRAEILPYDLSYKIVADRELTARILVRTRKKIGLIPAVVCQYDVNGVSASNLNQLSLEMIRLSLSFNKYLASLYVMMRYPVILVHRMIWRTSIYKTYRKFRSRYQASV